MTRTLTTVLLSVLLLASTAAADVLWDRSSFDAFGPGFFNADAGSPPFGITVYTVNHVTVGSTWNVDTITTYYSALDPGWGGGILSGTVHVFTRTGSLPVDGVDDPTVSPTVAMTATLEADHWRVTATGLNLVLAPGEYWIGMTPVAPSGPFGPEIHLASAAAPSGDDSASYDPFAFPPPPTWFNFNPGVEASILIEGTMGPVSRDGASFGAIKALYR